MHNLIRTKILAFLLPVVATLIPLTAQAQGLRLFTSDHDLSSTLISQIFSDSEGFIWISTESGLNLYDGSRVSIYKRRSDDDKSLAHDYVNSVFEDSKGHLLVCTHAGVQMFDRANNNFGTRARRADGTPFTQAVKVVVEMPDGTLIAVGNNVYRLTINGDEIIADKMPYSDSLHNIETATPDRRGNLWVGLHDRLVKVGKDNSIKTYHLDSSGNNEVSCIKVSDNEDVFVATSAGNIYMYNRASDSFEPVTNTSINGTRITDIYFQDNGDIFAGTDGAGLFVIKPTTGNFERVDLPMWNDHTLKIHSMLKDRYNNLWLGLYQRGLLLMPAHDIGFNSIDQTSGKNAYIGQSCISAIMRDPDGTLWIGTDNDGIYSLTPDFKQSRHYIDGVPRVVMRLFRDSAQNLWVGTYGKGMGILRPDGSYTPIPTLTASGDNAKNVYGFAETPDGTIWIATMGDGLFRYDPATRKATQVTEIGDRINNWISDIIYSSRDKRLYVGTYDGLFTVDPNSLQVDELTRGMIVMSIYEDRDKHNFWLSTPSGLALSVNGNIVKDVFTTDDGLPSNSIYSVQKSGNSLWISTNNGLSQYNTDTGTFINYTVNEGLQSNEFFKNASFADRHGNLYFGGINGLTYFNPDNINTSGKKLDLRITDFYVGGVSVKDGMTNSNGRRVTDQPVYLTKEFHLDSDASSFSVEFSSRQMQSTAHTEFFYSFDNGAWEKMPDGSTNQAGFEGRLINFSNVKSGRHTLRIKAVDNGVESSPLSVDIIVASPWYATWWACILYLLIAAAFAGVVIRHLMMRSKRKTRELEQKHENDIREAKLQFFTNISHEIRTPLTLVMSPVQHLLGEDHDPSRQKVYRTIMRNSQRIHKLVDEIMDLRKIDNKQMHLRYREVEIVTFIGDLFTTFLPAAQGKGIDLEYEHEGIDELMAWVDPDNFDKIVMNLLSNAVKYTPMGGYIRVRLSAGTNPEVKGPLSDYFTVEVIDSGMGISAADREHIFERFYQSGNNKIGGTGIGLHLTHSLVTLHRGEISVTDNPVDTESQRGVCFTVTLPRGNGHIDPSEIDDTENATLVGRSTIEFNTIVADQSMVPEPEIHQNPSSRKLIYIADDDNEVRNYLAQTMGEKYRVEAFANGALAYEAIHRQMPDLIITDVMMPEMDGITLATKVRQNVNYNHIPLVILSAKNREEDALDGLDTGADAYITKPFNMDILMRTVRNLLENRQILRNVYSGNQDQSDKVDDIQVQSSDEKLLERIMRVVNRNISNPSITVETIAREIGISRVHLHRKLKELTNQSTRDFIRNIRLQQAAKLLREKRLSVAEVSDLVGFKHSNNFSTNFKEMFGMSPSAYADQFHGPSAKSEDDAQ